MIRNHFIKNEKDLKKFQDDLYETTQSRIENDQALNFKDLLEVISSPVTITTAIHNIKSNKGSKTSGVDGKIIDDYLQKGYDEVIEEIQTLIKNYKPLMVRRVYINKANSDKKRPLGIPTIIDRIIQECVRLIIEPILEAQFFKHSYGFRPFRDANQAIARTKSIISTTGYKWVVEGDIKGFFDNINHRKLLESLWNMGIKDRRVLMVIKAMLKAGVLDESKENELGTPQGGIISPLLANAYLHSLDKWITREWENKKTRTNYKAHYSRLLALRKGTNLKPAYFIRYADDWILITDTKANAEKWKYRINKFLNNSLKIELSQEKTLITNITKRPIQFLGFEIKALKRNNSEKLVNKKLITVSKPDTKKVKDKVKGIKSLIRDIKSCENKNEIIHQINQINLTIRGIIQYYENATLVNRELGKYSHYLAVMATRYLRRRVMVEIVPAYTVNNLTSVHEGRNQLIPAIRTNGLLIGVTNIGFCTFKKPTYKNHSETPYSSSGRELYQTRTGKKPIKDRADELLTLNMSEKILISKDFHNYEYAMNRCYAYNRDKGKCRICGEHVRTYETHTHHINRKLPINLINKVNNLATTHEYCHKMIHSSKDFSTMVNIKTWNKILSYRKQSIK